MTVNPPARQKPSGWTRPFGLGALLGNLATDEELGKRDDDFNYHGPSAARNSLHHHGHTHTPAHPLRLGHGIGADGGGGGDSGPSFPWKAAPRTRVPTLRNRRRRLWVFILVLLVTTIYFFNQPDARSRLHQVAVEVGTHSGFRPHLPPPPLFPLSSGNSSPRPPTPDRPAPSREETMGWKLAYEKIEKMHQETVEQSQTYNGPFVIPALAESLQAIRHTRGSQSVDDNVLFAAANLLSVASLLPTACEMARHRRNYVHVAIFSRHDITIPQLQELNGVMDREHSELCPVIWHDARPDKPSWSSPLRAEIAMNMAFSLIEKHMHPQTVIVDDFEHEEKFFVDMMKVRLNGRDGLSPDFSIIELQRESLPSLSWITHLSAASLREWTTPTVDILIQPDERSLEFLPPLLRSLEEADYRGLPIPRLIIDLPPTKLSPLVEDALKHFSWPPEGYLSDTWSDTRWRSSNLLVVRHRFPTRYLSPEETSIRFLEAFHPADPANQHVLLLSPDVSLSPSFYQYLFFAMLEYRYGPDESSGPGQLAGISLIRPSELLTNNIPFSPPVLPAVAPPSDGRSSPQKPEKHPASFLWQSPSPYATLYFGDKWSELQSFLVNRVRTFHRAQDQPQNGRQKRDDGSGDAANGKGSPPQTETSPSSRPSQLMKPKLLSTTFPSWLEYATELFFAQAYTILIPGLHSADNAFATMLPEGYRVPPEFAATINSKGKNKHQDKNPDGESGREKTRIEDEPFLVPVSVAPSSLPVWATTSPVPLAPATELDVILPPPLVYSAFGGFKTKRGDGEKAGDGADDVNRSTGPASSQNGNPLPLLLPNLPLRSHSRSPVSATSSSSSSSSSPHSLSNPFRTLPVLSTLPIISFAGAAVDRDQLAKSSGLYIRQFRTEQGGCSAESEAERERQRQRLQRERQGGDGEVLTREYLDSLPGEGVVEKMFCS